jgi:hypothetical protein
MAKSNGSKDGKQKTQMSVSDKYWGVREFDKRDFLFLWDEDPKESAKPDDLPVMSKTLFTKAAFISSGKNVTIYTGESKSFFSITISFCSFLIYPHIHARTFYTGLNFVPAKSNIGLIFGRIKVIHLSML